MFKEMPLGIPSLKSYIDLHLGLLTYRSLSPKKSFVSPIFFLILVLRQLACHGHNCFGVLRLCLEFPQQKEGHFLLASARLKFRNGLCSKTMFPKYPSGCCCGVRCGTIRHGGNVLKISLLEGL